MQPSNIYFTIHWFLGDIGQYNQIYILIVELIKNVTTDSGIQISFTSEFRFEVVAEYDRVLKEGNLQVKYSLYSILTH